MFVIGVVVCAWGCNCLCVYSVHAVAACVLLLSPL